MNSLNKTTSMSAQDKIRAYVGVILTGAMLVLPVIAFLIGWQMWDARRGILLALVTFAAFFLLSALTFRGIKNPSALLAVIPFVLGMLYQISPADLPLPIDDTVVQLGGSILSFIMLRRSNPGLPWWTFFALAGSSLYDLLGIAIPGPIDELLVQLLALYGVSRANRPAKLEPPQQGG